MKLDSKSVVITGASSGIGKTFSAELIRSGARVYGIARSKEKLDRIREELGAGFTPVVLDVTDREAVDAWIHSLPQSEPDILINNAGFGAFAPVDEMQPELWDQMLETNLTGVYNFTRTIVPRMKSNPEVCHILNIASVAGLLGNPQLSAYNTTKFGLRGFSEALFKELRYDGIKVTCMFPGSIATEFFGKVGMETHGNMLQPEDVALLLRQLIELPDNFLVDEITLRPLNPKRPE